tara:strand:+ start:14072 stop:14488 length:417 start_codon:yes stop_codon:yes gene_type:complete
MNIDFYNKKYTIISKKNIEVDGYDTYNYTLTQACNIIKRHELVNDTFYSGHIIINKFKKDLFNKLIENIGDYKLNRNSCWFSEVVHSGVDNECSVDSSMILCSSWVLPFIAENSRSKNNLYGDCMAHRINPLSLNLSI